MGSSSSQNSTSHGGALRGAAPWPLTCSGACQETNELPSEKEAERCHRPEWPLHDPITTRRSTFLWIYH
ncbi:hypothetical protein FOBRF1_011136 [Fusarium oxysporum]